MTLAYAASVVMFYVFARYRYPLVPLLMIFAAAGVALRRRHRARRSRVSDAQGALAAVAIARRVRQLADPLDDADARHHRDQPRRRASGAEPARRGDRALPSARSRCSPDYAPAYNNLAWRCVRGPAGRGDRPVPAGARLRPDYPQAHYNLANALLERGRPGEAAEHFRIALQTIRGSADVHNNLGIALAGQGELAEAIAEFRAAVQLEPSRRSRAATSPTRWRARQYDERRSISCARAARLDPTGARALRPRQRAPRGRSDRKRSPRSGRAPARARRREAHNNLGIALGSRGGWTRPWTHFERALALKPDFADARVNRDQARLALRK